MRQRFVRYGVRLLCALVLAGCQRSEPTAEAPVGGRRSADRPAQPIAWTSAVSLAGGGLPVDLKFGLPEAPRPGVPFRIVTVLSATAAQPALKVQWRGDDALQVQSTAEVRLPRLDAGAGETLEATLTAGVAGLHVVTVKVALDLPGEATSRTYAFPVLVTNP
jgi:hypothetical protein